MQALKPLIDQVEWPPAGYYVVAVSGGVDSVVLLHLLASSADERNYRLRVAYFDHGWRPDSKLDQKLVRNLAEIYELPLQVGSAETDLASEAAARQARYRFLDGIRSDYGADAVVTAHHLDDRVETSFLNLLRGTDRAGWSPLKSRAGLLRPLLDVRKTDIIQYAQDHGLPWREDQTNTDLRWQRNLVRHELLPLARARWFDFDSSYEVLIRQADGLNEAIDQRLAAWIRQSGQLEPGRLVLERRSLGRLSLPALRHLLAYGLNQLQPGIQLSRQTLADLAVLVKTGGAGKQKPVGSRLNVELSYDRVSITLGEPVLMPILAQDLWPNTSIRFGQHQLSYGHRSEVTAVPVGTERLLVRRVRPGDRIKLKAGGGSKKLHDLFIDAKIDRGQREGWPVVVRQLTDRVVWVPDLAVCPTLPATKVGPATYFLNHEVI